MNDSGTISGGMDEIRAMALEIPTGTLVQMPLEIVRLQRDELGHADLFTKVLRRMRTFSESMGVAVGNAEEVIWKQFAEKSPLLGLWVAHRGGVIEAHLHADIRPWNGANVAWIAQAKIDDPKFWAADQVTEVLNQVMQWVRDLNVEFPQLGVQEILFNTFRDAKVWQRRFGFVPHSTLLARKLL